MKFSCDSCQAQYVISDDKVGPNGVIVRCKKCSQKIIVKKAAPPPADDEAQPTMVLQNPLAQLEAAKSAPVEATERDLPLPAAGRSGARSRPPPVVTGAVIDDELGRAFDSVLSEPGIPAAGPGADEPTSTGGFPSLGGAADDELDRQSTRVVDLAQFANLSKTEEKKDAPEEKPEDKKVEEPKKNLPAAAEAPAASGATEWFVAINDSQVGPLDVAGVRSHWDKGELSADSLVWRTGMPDWKPLSTVTELSSVLAPVPTKPESKPEAPAGATATGVQAPAPSSLPPQQDAAGEPEWKPSAASALESLVKEELQALDKPAPKPEPAPTPEPARSGTGLMDDLPEPSSSPGLPFEPSLLVAIPKSISAPAPEPAPEPAPRRTRRPEPVERPDPVMPPQPYVPGRASEPRSRLGLYIGLGVGGGLIGIGAIALLLVFVLTKQPNTAPVQVAQATPPTQPAPAPQPTAQPVAPAAPKEPEKVAAPAAEAKPPAVAAAAEPKQPEPKAAEPAPEPRRERVAMAEPTRPSRPAAPPAQPRATRQVHEEIAKAAEPPPEPPPPPRKSGNKVDDDFNKLFGGGGGEPAPEPARPQRTRSAPPIPPAPGAAGNGASKETLGPSDIMEVVRGNVGAIRRCTDDEKARSGASGAIKMSWIIRQNGSVTAIKTLTEEYQKTPLSACLTGVVKGLHFPAYSGPQMDPVEFPFKF